MDSRWIFPGLLVLFAIGTATLSRSFPPVETDEVFIVVHGYNLLSGKGDRYSLYDDIFAPSVYSYRDAFVQVCETITNTWFGIWTKIVSRNYWHSRLGSLSAGLLSLILFYQMGRLIGGIELGIGLVLLLMLDPVFLLANCVVRADIVLLLTSSLIVWLILRMPNHFPFKSFLIGTLSGLQVGAHPNSVALFFGILAFYWTSETQEKRTGSVALFIAGTLAGLLALVPTINLRILWQSRQSLVFQIMKPLFLAPPHSLSEWGVALFRKLYMTQTYYFDDNLVSGWKASLLCRTVGITCGLFGIVYELAAHQRKKLSFPWPYAFVYGLIGTYLAMTAIVPSQEVLYTMNFYPFLLPLIGIFLLSREGNKVLKGFAIFFLILSPCLMGIFASRYKKYEVPFSSVRQQFKTLVPDERLKVVAPNLFWYDCPVDRFRDIGALTYSHWDTSGQHDIAGWLRPWLPDILVVDSTFQRLFLRESSTPIALSRVLQCPVKHLGTLNMGSGSYGLLEVYRIDWSHRS